MKTTVVNKRYNSYDVYIGRGTPFGNPFIIGKHGTRTEVIAKYRSWFYNALVFEDGFREEVMQLKGKCLGCFCKPQACHGDIIAEYLNQGEE